MPALSETIAALFTRAASGPADATVARGLHLKARIVDGQRQLLLSRPDIQPSETEVTTCAKHGEIAAYTVKSGARWQLITEDLDLCEHTLGFSGMGDGKNLHFYFGSCITCKARWRREVARRGKGERWIYNGQEVTDWQFALLVKRGPKDDRSNESQDEQAWRELGEHIVERHAAQRQPLVDTVPQELAEVSAPALTGQICGTCSNGLPGQYPNEVECQLGWDRQDGALRPLLDGRFEWVAIPQGHGDLPLPIATPTASCAAVLGGGHPGWTARA